MCLLCLSTRSDNVDLRSHMKVRTEPCFRSDNQYCIGVVTGEY
jgi:hypothetical protein